MYLEIDEIQKAASLSLRYINMSNKWVAKSEDFDELIGFVRELHEIHQAEMKLIQKRIKQFSDEIKASLESRCNPCSYFQVRSAGRRLRQFLDTLERETFTQEVKHKLAEAFAKEPRILHIDVGFHALIRDGVTGDNFLSHLYGEIPLSRIHFAGGVVLKLYSLDDANELAAARELFEVQMNERMVPVYSGG